MVKGISKQVIVVHSKDKSLFDQAIFILSDHAVGKNSVTDQVLLQEAKRAIRDQRKQTGKRIYSHGVIYMAIGALLTGIVWILTSIL